MKSILAALLVTLIAAPASAGMRKVSICERTDAKDCQALIVAGRTVTFAQAPQTGSTAQALVDGKVVFTNRFAAYASMLAVAKLATETVVVIEHNAGGSGTFSQFALLAVPADRKAPVTVHELPETAQNARPAIMTDGKALKLDLGPYKGKRRISTYRQGTVSTAETADGGRVPDDLCRWVFDTMKSCEAMKEDDADCTASYEHMGMVAVRGFIQLGQYPRFGTQAAKKACIAACETGKAPSMASFRKAVCGS